MQNFYESFTFIISFMILVVTFQMIFGSDFIEGFLLLVLGSMLVLNSDKVGYIFKGLNPKEE